MKLPRVLLADDHAILLEAFAKLLEPTCNVVGTVTDGRALLAAVEKLQPDLVIADISMPQLNGLEACQQLKLEHPRTQLIFLTVSEDLDLAAEAIRRGASGFLLKKSASAELFQAIRTVLAGRHYITPLISLEPPAVFVERARSSDTRQALTLRQREVLQLLAEGRSMKEAADILKISPRTVAFHKYGMMDHLGIKTSAELVQHAVRLGLVATKGDARRVSSRP